MAARLEGDAARYVPALETRRAQRMDAGPHRRVERRAAARLVGVDLAPRGHGRGVVWLARARGPLRLRERQRARLQPRLAVLAAVPGARSVTASLQAAYSTTQSENRATQSDFD